MTLLLPLMGFLFISLLVTTLVGVLVGYWVDKQLGTLPVFLIVGFLVGGYVGIPHILGGGNAKRLKTLPKGCRLGNNSYAFTGGFRLWEKASSARRSR